MQMSRTPVIIACALAGLFLCGCATQKEYKLSELLRDLDALNLEATPGAAATPQNSVVQTGSSQPTGSVQPAMTSETPDRSSPPLPAPAAGAAKPEVSNTLTIQPDCLVQIRVEEDPSLDGSYAVNNIGAVQFGYVGPVILWNRTEEQAAQKIAEVLKGREFRNASISVKIVRASYDRVQVSGAVLNPSMIPIGAGDSISLSDALLRAGGVTANAKNAKVKIVRGGLLTPLAASMPGEEFSLAGSDGKPAIPAVYLKNNDMVRVFGSAVDAGEAGGASSGGGKEILVLGEVKRPGVYSFGPSEPCTLMYLVFKMGGLPPYANAKTIKVVRGAASGRETEHYVDARKVLDDGDPQNDFVLQNGDRVIVPARRISLF